MKSLLKIKNRFHELCFWRRFGNFFEIALRSLASKYRMVGLYDLESGPVIVDRAAADPNGIWGCLYWWEYGAALKPLDAFFKNHRPIGVLDCGANIGGFGLLLAQMGIEFREYHAVEMNPRTCGRLAFNLTNWKNHVPAKIYNAAVADCSGWVENPDVFGSDSQSLYGPPMKAKRSVRVPKIPLNHLLYRSAWESAQPELLKLDIEGAEFDAIQTLDSDALSGTSAIIIEIHDNRSQEAEFLVKYLELLSFKCISNPIGEWGVYTFLRS